MYQVTTKVPTIYQVQVPDSVRELLKILQVPLDLGLDAFVTQTLQCMGMGGFSLSLLAYMIIPLVVLFAIFIGIHLGRERGRCVAGPGMQTCAADTLAAPWMLLFPSRLPLVSSKAFSAFSCETFGDELKLLRRLLDRLRHR